MLINLIKYFCIIIMFVGCSASKKDDSNNISANNETASSNSVLSDGNSANQDNSEFTNQQINFEIKKMLAEINYLKEQLNKLDVKSSLYADPFSVYNKEIILNNGSSIFCKILSQDESDIFVETLIGNLTLNRSNVVRIVENIIVLEDGNSSENIVETIDRENYYKLNVAISSGDRWFEKRRRD